jgi:hypothetical protein
LPPKQIGKARRIDAPADICALGKGFENCLAHYVRAVDAGLYAIYLWDDEISPAVCQLMRQGRLGWTLTEALGPKNEKLNKSQLQEITTAFSDVGIPECAAFHCLECILEANCTPSPRTRRQRQQHMERRLLELEEAAWIRDLEDVIYDAISGPTIAKASAVITRQLCEVRGHAPRLVLDKALWPGSDVSMA